MRSRVFLWILAATCLVGCGGNGEGLFSGVVSGAVSDPIPLPDASQPPAEYPSVLVLSTEKTSIQSIQVLVRLTHERPRDVDLLLVGPEGQAVLLMADCLADTPLSNDLFLFQDDATEDVPDTTQPAAASFGPYRATNYDPGGDDDTFYPGPQPEAPGGPYGTDLTVFRGTNPSGSWRLYAKDDEPGGAGTQVDSWGLLIAAE